MINKRFIIALLIMALFSISFASAEENITEMQNEAQTETFPVSSNSKEKIKTLYDESMINSAEDEKNYLNSNITNSATFSDIQTQIDDASDGDVIYLNGKNYTGEGHAISINKSLTIVGGSNDDDNSLSTLDAKGLSQIMVINTNNVVIKGIKFINAFNDYGGGAVNWHGDGAKLIDSIFISNHADNGGAVYLDGWNNLIRNSTFINNSAFNGGAVSIHGQVSTIDACTFANNNASNGGAILFTTYGGNISNSIFKSNHAEFAAGAIICQENNVSLVNSTFINNYALGYGGALFWFGDDCELKNNTFTNNSAENCGAIIIDGNSTISDSKFINNHANDTCGAISSHEAKIKNNEFIGNSANFGGAVYAEYSEILDNHFTNNDAKSAGSVIWIGGPNLSFYNNVVEDSNSAPALYVTNSTNFTYNNVRDDQIAYSKIIIEILNNLGNVNTTHQLIIRVYDDLGNDLSSTVSVYAYNNDISFWQRFEEDLIDGEVTFNMTLPNQTAILDLEVYSLYWIYSKFLVANITQIDDKTIRIAFPNNSTGSVGITLGNKKFAGNITNDVALVSIGDLPNGEYAAEINYGNFTGNITILVKNSSLVNVVEVENQLEFTSQLIQVPVTVHDNLGNPINAGIVYCNCTSINYNARGILVDGNVLFTLPAQNMPKSLDLIICYDNIVKNVKVIVADISQKSNSIVVKLPSNASGYVNLTMSGKNYSSAVLNGEAIINFDDMIDGEYASNLTYSGDLNYPGVSKNLLVTVNHPIIVPVYKITNNKDVSVIYSGKATYKVFLTKDGKSVGAGESVTFNFNGKNYVVKTDANGYAALNLNTKVKVKTYYIKATYKGITVNNKVKVNQLIKASNKKVKKSSKVTKVKITLKKVNGKYLKSKKLTVKFNGKKYKVKTNKKGVAIWKVKKSMVKKLKVGKKVKYTVIYGKDTLTKKVTIRK